MPTCPNGHQSGSEDWCEVCGHRMAGPGAPAGAVPPPPPPPPPAPGYGYPPPSGADATGQAELCPQCRTPREQMAPFCEECRWNFLTNTATSYTPLAPQHQSPGGFGGPGGPGGPGGAGGPVPGLNLPPGFQAQPPSRPQDPFEYQSSRPSQLNRPAEPLSPDQSAPPGGPSAPPRPVPDYARPDYPQPDYPQPGPPPPSPYQQQSPPPYQQEGAPSPYQQESASQLPVSPIFQQSSAPPAPPGPQRSDDDWMLPPPSSSVSQPPAPQGPQESQRHEPAPQYQRPATWTAVIGPDRDYFMAMMQRSGPEATGLNLPAYSPEQRLSLTGNQIAIGRRRHSTGESPEIDLSVPPEDPGVSHQHAVLVHQPDGSWAVVDQNSTNGTTLNGAEDPIQPFVPVPLKDGDRVHVGAWTTITIRRD
ncbi:FHA domain-containing protein [Streptomyces sp. NPDC056987]|uniref:FHA domain-containing protein n=1 Tax=Streptomyces sp. NPDC056987 TaxID=3345988 RepID=UPI00362BF797